MLEALSRAAFERDAGRLGARLAAQRGWTVIRNAYPVLDVVFRQGDRSLRLRLDCSGWDDLPPSIELLAEDGSALGTVPASNAVFHPGPHPTTGRPFVCMRGSREFHTHPSHLYEAWDNYRGQAGNDLLGLVDQLCRAWKRGLG